MTQAWKFLADNEGPLAILLGAIGLVFSVYAHFSSGRRGHRSSAPRRARASFGLAPAPAPAPSVPSRPARPRRPFSLPSLRLDSLGHYVVVAMKFITIMPIAFLIGLVAAPISLILTGAIGGAVMLLIVAALIPHPAGALPLFWFLLAWTSGCGALALRAGAREADLGNWDERSTWFTAPFTGAAVMAAIAYFNGGSLIMPSLIGAFVGLTAATLIEVLGLDFPF
jgi:hypothetical protein